jgi:hypothetical protein
MPEVGRYDTRRTGWLMSTERITKNLEFFLFDIINILPAEVFAQIARRYLVSVDVRPNITMILLQ